MATKLNLKYTFGNHNPYVFADNSESNSPTSKSSPVKYAFLDSNQKQQIFNTPYLQSLTECSQDSPIKKSISSSQTPKYYFKKNQNSNQSAFNQQIQSSVNLGLEKDSPLRLKINQQQELKHLNSQFSKQVHVYSENNTPTNSFNQVHNHPSKSRFQKIAELTKPKYYLNDESEGELEQQFQDQKQNKEITTSQEQNQQQNYQIQQEEKEKQLPPKFSKHKYTLVLDLDETLIHTYNRNSEKKQLQFHVRPYAIEFLENLSKYYELVVFTASPMFYCNAIVNTIDHGHWVQHRLCENNLKYRGEGYVKDMSYLGRDLRHVIIVDNLEINFSAQPENGILIKDFYDDMSDNELQKLNIKLQELAQSNVDDVRPFLKTLKKQFN